MANKTNKNNLPKEKVKTEIKGSKIWLGDEGFLHVKVGDVIDEEIVQNLLKNYLELAKKLPIKPNVLVDMTLVPHTPFSTSSLFRKEMAKKIKEAVKDIGFSKAALWGGGAIQRTVVRFILVAARVKNIKHFKTEEEALKWLKEEKN